MAEGKSRCSSQELRSFISWEARFKGISTCTVYSLGMRDGDRKEKKIANLMVNSLRKKGE